MKTEERLMAMYANANPVELEDLLNMVELENAEYLATLEQRSSEMTDLDTETKEKTSDKRSWGVWLVAAAAALILGVALVLVTQSNDEAPVAETTSDPTATWNGDDCVYTGPSESELNSTVTFTVINESDTTDIGFSIWRLTSGVTAEELESGGIVETAGPGDGYASASFPPTPIGEPQGFRAFFDTPGQWGINCFESSGPSDDELGNDHITMFTVKG